MYDCLYRKFILELLTSSIFKTEEDELPISMWDRQNNVNSTTVDIYKFHQIDNDIATSRIHNEVYIIIVLIKKTY